MIGKSSSKTKYGMSPIKYDVNGLKAKVNTLVNDAYKKLNDVFTSHLSSLKTLPVDYCKSPQLLETITSLIEDHTNVIVYFVQMNGDKLVDDFHAAIKMTPKQLTKSKLNPSSASYSEFSDPFLDFDDSPMSIAASIASSNNTQVVSKRTNTNALKSKKKKLPVKTPEDEYCKNSLDPSAEFIDRLLSCSQIDEEESDDEFRYDPEIGETLIMTKVSKAISNALTQAGGSKESVRVGTSLVNTKSLVTNANSKPLTKPLGGMIFDFSECDDEGEVEEEELNPPVEQLPVFDMPKAEVEEEFNKDGQSCSSQDIIGIDISGVEDYEIKGIKLAGVYSAVKSKNEVYANCYLPGRPDTIHSVLFNTEDKTVTSALNLSILHPILNFISFKGHTHFYFCEDGFIYVGRINIPKKSLSTSNDNLGIRVFRTKETFKTRYRVSGKDYPTSSRSLCIGNNKLFYIDQDGFLASLSMASFSDPNSTPKTEQYTSIVNSNRTVDISFSRKHLIVLYDNGTIGQIFPSEKSILNQVPKAKSASVNLFDVLDDIPYDSEFTALSSSIFEAVVSSFSYEKGESTVYRVGNNMQLLDRVVLPEQQIHIHCIKLLIRKKRSYFIAVCRLSNIHILAVAKSGLTLVQYNVLVNRGPVDGICVINEDEMLVYEGTRNMLKKVIISSI